MQISNPVLPTKPFQALNYSVVVVVAIITIIIQSCPCVKAWNAPILSWNKSRKRHANPTTRGGNNLQQLFQSSNDRNDNNKITSRRSFLTKSFWTNSATAAVLLIGYPQAAHAGEVGARITKAVTQSDLGISVRTSVVKGAQVMDQMDGQWERFSDRFGLGSERLKAGARPTPKIIPDPLPLDSSTAQAILQICDDVYLSIMSSSTLMTRATLEGQIQKVAELVRPSFERYSNKDSALMLQDNNNIREIKTAEQFNFASYVHFKAYSDLILMQGKSFDFNAFRRIFEYQVGQRLIKLLLPQAANSQRGKQAKSEQVLGVKLGQIDQLCQQLKDMGLLSLTERSELEKDQILDWMDDTNELSFTVALDGDITLGSQMLLQEQGFRLYPDYARFAVLSLLQNIEGQVAQIEDYYFDTDYNSDPDKFEVKEVVLNVVLDSA